MDTFVVIFLIVLLLGLIYYGIRKNKVYNFLDQVLDAKHRYNVRMIQEGNPGRMWHNFDVEGFYNKMFWSFKPLKWHIWFEDWQVEIIIKELFNQITDEGNNTYRSGNSDVDIDNNS
jgi:hypothetical protein